MITRRTVGRAVAFGAVTLAAIALAGCYGTTGAASAPSSLSAPMSSASAVMSAPVETPSTITVPPPTSIAAPAPAGPAGNGECKAAGLKLTLGPSSGAAGHVYQALQFTNTGSAPCAIGGFAGVSYVTGDNGTQVGAPAQRDGSMGGPVTLAPGQTASAVVTMTDVGVFDPNACKPASVRGLRVYPPDDTASMFVTRPGTGCAGNPPSAQLRVQTVKAGAGGM